MKVHIFSRTRNALAEYDKTQADVVLPAFAAAKTDADVRQAALLDSQSVDAVRDAFALDTADRNSPENARLAGIKWLRQLVADESDGCGVDGCTCAGWT